MIAILNYGVGNIMSIANILKRNGIPAVLTQDVTEINAAERIILPGVGSFDHCMQQLYKAPFYEYLPRWAFEEKKPILGICVGMQMLFESSEEGSESGLGWIKGKVVKFDANIAPIKIPHMGWNYVADTNNSSLFEGLERPKYYFVHSYYAQPTESQDIAATAEYGAPFTVAVRHGNIYGVQFHPEKSHRYGMQLLTNFANLS
jgi:imidazole glycerol-phosphate synthase subunit HisH